MSLALNRLASMHSIQGKNLSEFSRQPTRTASSYSGVLSALSSISFISAYKQSNSTLLVTSYYCPCMYLELGSISSELAIELGIRAFSGGLGHSLFVEQKETYSKMILPKTDNIFLAY